MRGGKEAEYVHIVKEDLKLSLLINAEIVCVKRLFKWTTLSPNPGISNGEWKGHRIWDQTKIWNQIYNSISSWEGVFPDSSVGKESTCNAGDLVLIPGLGRSHGEGSGCLLQISSLENSMGCIVHGVAELGVLVAAHVIFDLQLWHVGSLVAECKLLDVACWT